MEPALRLYGDVMMRVDRNVMLVVRAAVMSEVQSCYVKLTKPSDAFFDFQVFITSCTAFLDR